MEIWYVASLIYKNEKQKLITSSILLLNLYKNYKIVLKKYKTFCKKDSITTKQTKRLKIILPNFKTKLRVLH